MIEAYADDVVANEDYALSDLASANFQPFIDGTAMGRLSAPAYRRTCG